MWPGHDDGYWRLFWMRHNPLVLWAGKKGDDIMGLTVFLWRRVEVDLGSPGQTWDGSAKSAFWWGVRREWHLWTDHRCRRQWRPKFRSTVEKARNTILLLWKDVPQAWHFVNLSKISNLCSYCSPLPWIQQVVLINLKTIIKWLKFIFERHLCCKLSATRVKLIQVAVA
jgi:hypothetical protein